MANDKPKMKYRVVVGKKPGTSVVVLRPQITERETYYVDQVVEYALNSGYIRGQFEDSKGTVNGFFEAVKSLSKAGKAVNLANWLRVHAELTGSVDQTEELTDANDLKVDVTALQDLKAKVSEFSWTNIGNTGPKVKIDSALSSGAEPGYFVKGGAGIITGKNLQYVYGYGDRLTCTWTGHDTEEALVVSASDYAHIGFDPGELWDALEDGTLITLHLRSRGGVEGAPDQMNDKSMIFKISG